MPTTLLEVKQGKELSAPIYVAKPYVVLSKENVVLFAGALDDVKKLDDYYDQQFVEARENDLYLNDNTKISDLMASPAKKVADEISSLLIQAQNMVARARTLYMSTAQNEGLDPSDFDKLFESLDVPYLVGMEIRRK